MKVLTKHIHWHSNHVQNVSEKWIKRLSLFISPQDCPAESGDFRAQQCSAHNDIKYQGVTHEWVPAPYDPSAPCALRCQAKGRSLTIELAPKVLDGTRCRADAFDMCISGVCQVRHVVINQLFSGKNHFPPPLSLPTWVRNGTKARISTEAHVACSRDVQQRHTDSGSTR